MKAALTRLATRGKHTGLNYNDCGPVGANHDYLAGIGTTVSTWLSSPYVVAFIVPMGFFFIGAFGKKLIRDGREGHFWSMKDWYLAPDAALANIGAGLAECLDRASKFDPSTHHGQIRGTLVFLCVAIFIYLIVLALHKHYEHGATWKRTFWLLAFANGLAFLSMFVFVRAVKGVSDA